MFAVSEINDPADLGALKPQWDELLERTPGASFFQSLAWLQIYWKHFGARKRLRVLLVLDQDQIIGILPLVVHIAHRSEPFRALTYPLANWGNFYGPIGPDPLATLVAGLDHIRRTPRDWHFIELAWVDALVDAGRTNSALDTAGFHATCETQNTTAIIDLAEYGSWEAYFATRRSGTAMTYAGRKRNLPGAALSRSCAIVPPQWKERKSTRDGTYTMPVNAWQKLVGKATFGRERC
jgi:hypothetical protein